VPKKLRSQKITIDLPTETSEVWVHAVLQTVFKDTDYRTIQTIDLTGHINRSISQFATQMESVTDPVTGQQVTMSGAGVATLIKQFIIKWIQEDNGGTLNEVGDLIVEDS